MTGAGHQVRLRLHLTRDLIPVDPVVRQYLCRCVVNAWQLSGCTEKAQGRVRRTPPWSNLNIRDRSRETSAPTTSYSLGVSLTGVSQARSH